LGAVGALPCGIPANPLRVTPVIALARVGKQDLGLLAGSRKAKTPAGCWRYVARHAVLPTAYGTRQLTVCQAKKRKHICDLSSGLHEQTERCTLDGRAGIAHRAQKPQGSGDSALRYKSYPLRLWCLVFVSRRIGCVGQVKAHDLAKVVRSHRVMVSFRFARYPGSRPGFQSEHRLRTRTSLQLPLSGFLALHCSKATTALGTAH
jgi:hypothetical protein